MDAVKLMMLQEFFRIMDEEGEEAAIAYAEEATGRRIEKGPDHDGRALKLVRTSERG